MSLEDQLGNFADGYAHAQDAPRPFFSLLRVVFDGAGEDDFNLWLAAGGRPGELPAISSTAPRLWPVIHNGNRALLTDFRGRRHLLAVTEDRTAEARSLVANRSAVASFTVKKPQLRLTTLLCLEHPALDGPVEYEVNGDIWESGKAAALWCVFEELAGAPPAK